MNDGAALGLVLDQVSKDKNIDRAVLVETLEQAILTAAKRAFGMHREMEAKFNEETGRVDLFQIIVIVDQVTPGKGVHAVVPIPAGPIVPASLVARALEAPAEDLASFDDARRSFERDYLSQLMRITEGNVTQAARLAKRNRSDFYSLLDRHQLDPASFKK